MTVFERTPRNTVRRLPARAAYDREQIYAIVDAAPICHVGFVQEGQPYVIPTIHARLGDTLVFHGAPASRLLKHIAAGEPLCVAVTVLDGIVLARSVFHHSMNYRSAVLFGRGRILEGEEKWQALEAITEHVWPGRWGEARQPTPQELKATLVVGMEIESASAKVRTGPPKDDEADYALPIWAGVVPVSLVYGEPEPDPHLAPGIAPPPSVQRGG